MKDNIVLTGMPGAGKSTVGVVLAKVLGYEFIDSDLVIQKEDGRLLKDIIEQDGNEGFLAIEERINSGINASHAVIATGGSAVYGEKAMKHFAETGTVVYLKASYETVASRLSNLHGRGVAIRQGQTLLDLYNERAVLYERYSDFDIDIDGLSIEETVAAILRKI